MQLRIRHQRAGEHPSTRWRSGRGASALVAETVAWRLSIETIESSAELPSLFARGDERRVLCLVRGSELVVRSAEAVVELERLSTCVIDPGAAVAVDAEDGTRQCISFATPGDATSSAALVVVRVDDGVTLAPPAGTVAVVVVDGALNVSTPSSGFPGTPSRGRALRLDALIVDDDPSTHASTVTAALDTVVVCAVLASD